MLKRVLTLVVAAGLILTAGCSSRGGSGGNCGSGICLPVKPHCEKPCYCKSFQRASRQIMDVVDVHLLNYDRHDPFRCDPCIGD